MSTLARALRTFSLLGVLVAPLAHAQSARVPPAPYERPALAPPTVENQITANISAGATLNGGNTRSFGATAGGRFQLIRKPHQLTLDALFAYTAAARSADEDVDTTARNVVGRVRYDIYLSDNNALFAALAPRHDRYAGIDLRLQAQVGYLRNLYRPSDNHRLWVEMGYDGTYDNLTPWLPAGQMRAPGEQPPPKTEFIHSGRVFLGYTNLLTPLATLNLGAEFLYDFMNKRNIRLNPTVEITSSLNARFKLSLLSRILFDNVPVDETKKKTDYITTAQIVFTFDSVTPPPVCPACDCSEEVTAAKSACKQTTSPADASMAPLEEPGALDTAPPATLQPMPVQPAPGQAAPVAPAP